MEHQLIYCTRCDTELNKEINWYEEYECPFNDDNTYCDFCFYYLEGQIK